MRLLFSILLMITSAEVNKEQIIGQINDLRLKKGLSALIEHSSLNKAAQDEADWLASNKTLISNRGHMYRPSFLMQKYGYVNANDNNTFNSKGTGENYIDIIEKFFADPMIDLYKRKEKYYKHIGVGIAKDSNGVTYWCIYIAYGEPERQTFDIIKENQ